LTDYASAISTLYKTASVKYKPILLDAFNSAKVLLASPQVANSS
jgi:hypothetical protein